jgi:hypothetical protein
MDHQSQQPVASGKTTNPQPVEPLTRPVTVANQQDKPKLNISDNEAQAILTINNLQARQKPKTKPPIKLLIAVLGLILVVVLVSFLLGAFKPGGNSKSSNPVSGLGLPNQSNPKSGKDVSNQINQDVNACSNPLNATTVC